jgi:hypothetical protein
MFSEIREWDRENREWIKFPEAGESERIKARIRLYERKAEEKRAACRFCSSAAWRNRTRKDLKKMDEILEKYRANV